MLRVAVERDRGPGQVPRCESGLVLVEGGPSGLREEQRPPVVGGRVVLVLLLCAVEVEGDDDRLTIGDVEPSVRRGNELQPPAVVLRGPGALDTAVRQGHEADGLLGRGRPRILRRRQGVAGAGVPGDGGPPELGEGVAGEGDGSPSQCEDAVLQIPAGAGGIGSAGAGDNEVVRDQHGRGRSAPGGALDLARGRIDEAVGGDQGCGGQGLGLQQGRGRPSFSGLAVDEPVSAQPIRHPVVPWSRVVDHETVAVDVDADVGVGAQPEVDAPRLGPRVVRGGGLGGGRRGGGLLR